MKSNIRRRNAPNPHWLLIAVMSVVVILVYALMLDARPLNNPDESRYSTIALEMLRSGDFITPRFNSILFLDKPPLYFWMQAVSIKVFGLSNGALRLFPALFALMGCYCTFYCSRVLFCKRTGLLAAGILLSSPMYYFVGLYANLDMEVAVLISSALMIFAIGLFANLTRGKQRRTFYLAYVLAGLAVLTKGLIGIVLPALSVGLYMLLANQWRALKHVCLASGLLIIVLINAPWYFYVEKANPGFLHFFFYEQQVHRFISAQFNAHNPFCFYPLIILAGMFPWSVFIVQSLQCLAKKWYYKHTDYLKLLFLFCTFIAITVFFSLPASKPPSYIVPAFTPLSILFAYYMQTDGLYNVVMKHAFFTALIIISLLFLAGIVLYFVFVTPFTASLFVLAGFISLLIGGSGFLFIKNKRTIYLSLFISSFLSCTFFTLSLPLWINHFSAKKLAIPSMERFVKRIKQHKSWPVYAYHNFYYDLPLLLNHSIYVVDDWTKKDIILNDSWLGKFAWGEKQEGKSSKQLVNYKDFWRIYQRNSPLWIIAPIENLADFKDYQLVFSDGRDVLLTHSTSNKSPTG